MTIIKTYALTGAAFFVMASFMPANAKNLDAELKQKLDTIMQTEQDVSKASVQIEVAPQNNSNTNGIDFTEFDLNKDGIFERDEVGERLFTVFDRDKNGVIDNLEMKKVSLKVRTPMEKTTVAVIDYQTPGKEQVTRVSQEEFLQESRLIKFDKDGDGLSPLDFLEMPFNQVNVNRHDSVIDMYEWKRAYAASVKPLHMESFSYNN